MLGLREQLVGVHALTVIKFATHERPARHDGLPCFQSVLPPCATLFKAFIVSKYFHVPNHLIYAPASFLMPLTCCRQHVNGEEITILKALGDSVTPPQLREDAIVNEIEPRFFDILLFSAAPAGR